MLLLLCSPLRGWDDEPSPEQLRALYVGQWQLKCHWTNDVARLGTRPGESMGNYEGKATIVDRDGQLILQITGEAPNGMRWDKELALLPGHYRLALDPKRNKRRSSLTEYTRMDLVLSPDRTTLRGIAAWSNGLTTNRSNEEQLLRALPPSGFYPWGVGFSSICLTRQGTPPESPLSPPRQSEKPTILLEAFDPDGLIEPNELKAALGELEAWLTGMGYEVCRENGESPPDFRGTLEVARFQPTLSGQEFYLDTVTNKPVRFMKGTIPLGVSFTIKDSKGKRPLMSISLQRVRDSATPNEDPKTRSHAARHRDVASQHAAGLRPPAAPRPRPGHRPAPQAKALRVQHPAGGAADQGGVTGASQIRSIFWEYS